MTTSEALVRSVLGPCRRGIRPFVCAIEQVVRLSFAAGVSIETIRVTKDVYPLVARELHMKPEAASRQIERIANDCWDSGDRERLNAILGAELQVCPSPREMLFYFAAYTHYGIPFREAIQQELAAMF